MALDLQAVQELHEQHRAALSSRLLTAGAGLHPCPSQSQLREALLGLFELDDLLDQWAIPQP